MTTREDRQQAIKLFALINGWNKEWLVSQQEAMESLYSREFSMMEAAIEALKYSSYPMQHEDYLRHDFLKAFFARNPRVEMLSRPRLNFVAPPLEPKFAESYSYEEAWKYHAQVMVLIEKSDEREEYLYKMVPKSVIDEIEKAESARHKRIYDIQSRV